MADWVAVVDNDATSLKTIGQILNRQNIDSTSLESGGELLEFLGKNHPDLILLNISLPDMDGFEALGRIRSFPESVNEIPVIILTTEEEQEKEKRGVKLGAVDYIRKPFSPEVLLNRVQNALRMQEQVRKYERDVMMDPMTGFLNKNASETKMEDLCSRESGFLCVLDLDVFKLVNDFYGHDVGDQVLILFSHLIRRRIRSNDVCGRIGGDEFVLFIRNMHAEDELHGLVERINNEFLAEVRKLLGPEMQLPLGVSVGAVAVPDMGRDYSTLFRFADRALYTVKQNGKHDCLVYGHRYQMHGSLFREMNLESTTAILEERNVSPNAMWMGEEAFISIYRYMVRYMERYHGVAFRVLFTVDMAADDCTDAERDEVIMQFRNRVQRSLRNSDVMMEVGSNKLFLLLPAAKDYDVEKVIGRLMENWHLSPYHDKTIITYETGHVHLHRHDKTQREGQEPSHAVLVAAEAEAGDITETLRGQNILVSPFCSVSELLPFLRSEVPHLILLDAHALGEEIYIHDIQQLLDALPQENEVPVVLLTESQEQEARLAAISYGELDFIRKPFSPAALSLRVKHILELANYRKTYSE